MSFRMRNREVIDVDSIPGLDKDRPVDLTAFSDDDEIVPLGTYIPNRTSMGANRHRRNCPNGPMSSIQVTFTDTPRSIKQRSDKRPVPLDVHRAPPPKRQRTDNAHQHGRSAPMKKSPENDLGVIDFEESDDESVLFVPYKAKSNQKSSDDEYESFHAGYDMGNPANWIPVKYNESRLDFEAPDNDASYLQHSPPRSQRWMPDFSTGTLFNHTGPRNSQLIWETLRSSGVFRSAPKPCAWALPSTLYSRSRYNPPNALSLNMSFKKAPGGINRIIQSGPNIGIASAATGGDRDRDEETGETVDPYNREGAAMVWNGTLHQLEAHNRRPDNAVKQYTVNDIKFDTLNQRLVTTGRDRGLEIWSYWAQNSNEPTLYQSWNYPQVPNEIAFKPGTSVYAVAEHIVHVYSSTDAGATEEDLRVAPKKSGKDLVGSMTWGRGPTANKLFASTEPSRTQKGWHKGFDVTVGRPDMTMDTEEAGDAMAMTDNGDTLALFTRADNALNRLRLYDIRNSQSKAYSKIVLEPFSSNTEPGDLEVISAAFRDDGIYLAVGRNDNHTHVYDTRMQHRLLFDYVHDGPFKNSPGSLSYGITALDWVDQFTSSLSSGLVTGGSDGCVRLWDPRKSDQNEDNGVVIAETNSDIGYFSIGDRFNGEQELVVGDCAGEVYFFGMSQNKVRTHTNKEGKLSTVT